MDPTKWGPHLWFFMHTVSFNYPETPNFKNKVEYNDFYNSLKNNARIIIGIKKCE